MRQKNNNSALVCSVGDIMSRIHTVPNTNDWYLTTDEGITLGPYRNRKEAATMLALLRRQARPNPTRTDRRET